MSSVGEKSTGAPPASPVMGPAEVMMTLRKKVVTMGKESGFFVPTKDINIAEKAILRMAKEVGQGGDSSELDKALDELHLMKEKVAMANKTILDIAARRDALAKEHKSAVEELTVLRGTGPESMAANTKLSMDYKRQLDALQKELGKAKVAGKAAAKGFDPEAAVAADEHEASLRAQVKQFQSERKKLDQAVEAARSAEKSAAQLAADRLAELNKLNATLGSMKSKKALSQSSGPLQPLDITVRTPVVRALIGDKGIAWLKKIDLQSRENMRDYAHHLMQAANGSKATKGLGDLLHYVWTWMKSKAYAAREALRPWVERIHRDLAAGALKSLKVYREALEEVIKDFKIIKKETAEKYANNAKWQVNLLSGLKTVVSQAKKGPSRLYRVFSSVRSTVRRVFTWALKKLPSWSRERTDTLAEDAKLFDVDDHISMEDHDVPEPSEGPGYTEI